MISGDEVIQAMAQSDVRKRLIIRPFFDEQLQVDRGAASIDLRLGCRFAVTRKHRLAYFPTYDDKVRGRLTDEYYVPLGDTFTLHPRQFALATTLEWVRLPEVYGGYILSRSSYGRRGLIIATAVGVHPGYSGVLTLELTNVAEIALKISPGEPICQLFLHKVHAPSGEDIDKSAFLGSLRPTLGELRRDKLTDFLTRDSHNVPADALE